MCTDFTIGRGDFSVTVYVPWNCTNNCIFCSSKRDYEKKKTDFEKLRQSLITIRNSVLPIVVFTGGEPSSDMDGLQELLEIVSNKIVYINTSLPQKNSEKFIELVNRTECVQSISISRHHTSYEKDSSFLHNIAPDSQIQQIEKSVRINVVEHSDDTFSIENIKQYVERWESVSKGKKGVRPIVLNLRGNYHIQNPATLHELSNNRIVNELADTYFYRSHSFCNVCDTCCFSKIEDEKETLIINYHRGLAFTAVPFGHIVEVNDFIIFQDGSFAYDWDGKTKDIQLFLKMICQQNNKE